MSAQMLGHDVAPDTAEEKSDYRGRVQTLKTWQNAAAGTGSALTTWIYDSNSGLLINKRDNSNQGATNAYVTGSTAGAGKPSRRDWARGGTYATYTYNNAGELASITYSGTPTTPNVSLSYDRQGNPNSIVQGSMTETLTYNTANELLGESFSGGDLNGLSTSYAYDALWRQTNLIASSGGTGWFTNSYAYDSASRVSSVARANKTAGYSYITNSTLIDTVTFQDNGTTAMTSSRTYDFINRLKSINSYPNAGTALNYAYTYNSANQRTKLTQTDNSFWSFQYDALGQVTSGKRYWSDSSSVAGQQFSYSFDDIGNRLATERGGNEWGAGTRWANYTNNLLNQLTSRSVPSKFDVMGSATNNSTVTVNNEPASRKSDFYRAELTVDNATGPVYVSITNLSVLNNGSSTNDLIANQTGNVFIPQSPEQLTYDLDGNLLTDGRWTYSWDGENRLVTMTGNTNVPTAARLKLEFTYDWRGRRISKKTSTWNGSSYVAQSTNRFLYEGWNLVAEADVASGTLLRSYVWGLDLSGTSQGAGGVGGLAITVVHTGTEAGSYFVAFDGNGNVGGMVLSSDGIVRAIYEYGPFGEVIGTSGPVAKINPFRFSTKYQDDESDLVYYGYRFYNTSTARWLSRDPIEEQGGRNLFGFLSNDPLGTIDSFGLYSVGGHYYGTFLGARADGYSVDQATELAYYTQLPDVIPATDAYTLWKAASFPTFFKEQRKTIARFVTGRDDITNSELELWRRSIFEAFHSFHGGGADRVNSRRECLERMLHDPKLSSWEKGFINHALGDAYAHVKDGLSGLSAYGYPDGHKTDSVREVRTGGLSNTDPDQIFNFPGRFQSYLDRMSLGNVLGGPGRNELIVDSMRSLAAMVPEGAEAEARYLRGVATLPLFGLTDPYVPLPGQTGNFHDKYPTPSAAQINSLLEKLRKACCSK